MRRILAIETSCDETAAAVVTDSFETIGAAVSTSSSLFESFGGIVPELAAREQIRYMIPVIAKALGTANMQLSEVDAIVVTIGPGLIGSLLVGVETAKTISMTLNKPIIPVHHVHAHLASNFLSKSVVDSDFPAIGLVVSGGHTDLFLCDSPQSFRWLGGSVDDAAGEAFDKGARLLGFGHGGGKAIEMAATQYTIPPKSAPFLPRPLMHEGSLNFSFSGLKTALMRAWENSPKTSADQAFLAWELQEAVTDVLIAKTHKAIGLSQAKSIFLSGGVAANKRLNEKFQIYSERESIPFFAPPLTLCTDNAEMIGAYAQIHYNPVSWDTISAHPNLPVDTDIPLHLATTG